MLVTRYLLRNVLTVAVFVTVTLTMVIWLTQSLKLLELVASSDAPVGIFLKLVALTMPRFLEIILPIALVAATLFSYNKMTMDNELIVMRSCGFNQYRLAWPVLMVALGMTVVLLTMTTYFSPRTYSDMQMLRQNVKAEYSSFLLREGVFNTFGSDLTVFVRRRDSEGDLIGLLIHDTRDRKRPPVTIAAKRGKLVLDNDIPQIVVYEGVRQQADNKSGSISKLYFSRYMIEIKGFEGGAEEHWKSPNERTFYELLHPDMKVRRDRESLDLFRAEMHRRIVLPFNALAFSLVAVSCILLGPFNRRGQAKKVLFAGISVVVMQSLNLVLISATRKNAVYIPVLYALTFAPIGLCLYILTLKGEQQLNRIIRLWQARGQARASQEVGLS